MIVKKTVQILNELKKYPTNTIIILNNEIRFYGKKRGELSSKETEQMRALLKRNKNINLIDNWYDYIQYLSDNTIENLNQDHYYKYEDRGWTFYTTKDKYIVDVFIDNYDVEQPFEVHIPKNSITDNDLSKLKRNCRIDEE